MEADRTMARTAELAAQPVAGKFDAAHLREIHRRLFQDLPAVGIHDVHPGEFRPPTTGGTWVKVRGLETVPGDFPVAYSKMDGQAQARLDAALSAVRPEALSRLPTAEAARAIGTLYAEADYVHPFHEGNSRALRAFTRQLAQEAGFALDWERFAATPAARDRLAIGRDRAVLERVLPEVAGQSSERMLSIAAHRISANPDVGQLVGQVMRPARAVAFERLEPAEAVARYPELTGAYARLQVAAELLAGRAVPSSASAGRGLAGAMDADRLSDLRATVQARLDANDVLAPPTEREITRLRTELGSARAAPVVEAPPAPRADPQREAPTR